MKPKVQDMMGASDIVKELQKKLSKNQNIINYKDLTDVFDSILNI